MLQRSLATKSGGGDVVNEAYFFLPADYHVGKKKIANDHNTAADGRRVFVVVDGHNEHEINFFPLDL